MVAAERMGPSQAPVCEAFIMTGDTILKTYTNKSEKGVVSKRVIRAADTTTPPVELPRTLAPGSVVGERRPSWRQAQANITKTTSEETSTTKSAEGKPNVDCNQNDRDYLKQAQYRVAAAIEQRAKSLSLSRLNEISATSSNGFSGTRESRSFVRRKPDRTTAGGGGESVHGDKSREPEKEEASARVRYPVARLHEQQAQQEQQQQQQQRQQKPLHEHVSRQNSEESTKQRPANETDGANNNSISQKAKQLDGCKQATSEEGAKKEDKQVNFCGSVGRKKQRAPIPAQRKQMDQPKQNHVEQSKQPAPVTRTETFIVTSRSRMKKDSSKLNGGQRFDDDDFSIEFKTGYLTRKRIFEARGKPTSKGKRGWRRVYVILRDLRFIVRYGQQENGFSSGEGTNRKGVESQKMEEQSARTRKQLAVKDLKNTIRLHHSFAKRSTTYTKREYVFHLQLADQSELLLQAGSESEMNSWIDTINFASACLSSPPLPSAVASSSKRYHQSTRSRPILPSSYTKLSYWEQLTDHEERLERLKTELEEHLNEAPVKRHASKHSKSEFIDKIAYLRQKIEHYTVYLDLMQKKSNSPEAIVLSKHPQIASLTPSKEMVQSLPLNAKVREDDDEKVTN